MRPAQAISAWVSKVNLSNQWGTLKDLRPKLPTHVAIKPRSYGGENWYVAHDKLSNSFHRLNHTAYQIVGQMNGRRSLEEIVTNLTPATREKTQNTQEVIQLLQYLYASDLLICEAPPKSEEIADRKNQKHKNKIRQLLKNPLIWRIPLINPNNFLAHCVGPLSWISSPFMALVWLLSISAGIVTAATHWEALTQHTISDIFALENLILLWLTYPFLKVFHEFGHAIFTKKWGGHVTECGVVVILGTPLPYVDATSATGFRDKKKRLMVSAAGMAVELLIASIAMIAWATIDDALWKSVLFNIILIGSVSTVFFNGNPLMRFDGYYLVCDLLDTPNLASRAQKQLGYILKRYLLNIESNKPHSSNKQQAIALAAYGTLAFFYRFFILCSLVLIAAAISPWLGIVLALWLTAVQLVIPTFNFLMYLATHTETQANRKTAVGTVSGLVLATVLFMGLIPIPHNTTTQGIIWLPDDSRVRSASNGLVVKEFAIDGQPVKSGQAILQIQNPELKALLDSKKISLREFETRYHNAWQQDRNQVKLVEQDIESIKMEIAHIQQRVDALTIRSKHQGTYKTIKPHNLIGSYIKQGDTVGIIITQAAPRVRTALNQDEVAKVQQHSHEIKMRLASMATREWTGNIARETPKGTFQLPSPALGTAGGGNIRVKRGDAKSTETTEQVFLMDIQLHQPLQHNLFGERVFIRFVHPSIPIGHQLLLGGRKLLAKIIDDKIGNPTQ